MKINIAVTGLIIFIIISIVGCMICYEQLNQMEEWMDEHPGEELEIGGPPVFTDLRLVAVVVVVAAILCGICLNIKPKEDDKKQP